MSDFGKSNPGKFTYVEMLKPYCVLNLRSIIPFYSHQNPLCFPLIGKQTQMHAVCMSFITFQVIDTGLGKAQMKIFSLKPTSTLFCKDLSSLSTAYFHLAHSD